jgi:hypothetical protein
MCFLGGLNRLTNYGNVYEHFVSIYLLLKSERLNINTKLTLYNALIRYIMTCACLARKFAGDSHVLKLQRLQNKVLLTTGNLPRRTPTRDLHMTFKTPYLNDFVTKLCRQQTARENANVCNISHCEAQQRKYERVKIGGGQAYD